MSGQGAPLGLLLRHLHAPPEHPQRGGEDLAATDERWQCPTAVTHPGRTRRSWAILKLAVFMASLAAGLVASVLLISVGLWWSVQHLASVSPGR